ncbi:hypothetical protein IWX50DRAFT_644272 [Phyllosticta citricarpa]
MSQFEQEMHQLLREFNSTPAPNPTPSDFPLPPNATPQPQPQTPFPHRSTSTPSCTLPQYQLPPEGVFYITNPGQWLEHARAPSPPPPQPQLPPVLHPELLPEPQRQGSRSQAVRRWMRRKRRFEENKMKVSHLRWEVLVDGGVRDTKNPGPRE